ncbi:hypothetical protein EJB05_37579, partial [Eragrostis curvula]
GKRRIPIVPFEITGGTKAFRKLMRRRWGRASKIASALIGQHKIPVTPLPNPVSGDSYHIVRLFDKLKPGYCVDLLFRDTDGYLVAFRRLRLNNEGQWIGRIWFPYSDVKLPEELKVAVSLGFDSSHRNGSKTTPGNVNTMHHMFEILSRCEDRPRDRKTGVLLNDNDRAEVKEALLRAIVIFSESFRFQCIYLSMLERIVDGQEETEVDPATWKIIHNWGHASDLLLDLWKSELPLMHSPSPQWFQDIHVPRPRSEMKKLKTMEDLIGSQGEFKLLNASSETIISTKERLVLEKKLKKRSASPIQDPGFELNEAERALIGN